MATLATLAAQRWRLLICGLRHGRSVEALQQVLEDFQPAAIFLELDREDFYHLRCRRDHFTDAAPEVAEAIRWAEQRQRPLTPLDRPQLCTRRRLAQRMALGNPMQLYAVRRYWGEMPQEDATSWRAKLQRDCPILHEVMLEERDEFMTYRILLALERRLAQRSVKGQSLNSGALGLPALLEQRAALEKQRLNEAMRANQSRSTIGSHDWENVLVLCGPAHVKELQRRLQFALSDPHFSPRFLAMNAALLPHLWRNQSQQPQPGQIGDLGDMGGRWDVELAAKTQELLEEAETKVAPVATTAGFGPLTMLADQVWRLLPQVDGEERPVQYGPPSVEFIHERLRELSKKPLPIWPIVLLVYITCPLLVFVVIPAAIDLYWLRIGPQVPLSLLIDSQEEEDVREKDPPWNSSCEATLRKLTDKLPHSDCNKHASMFHGIRKCKTM